jgi:hypothetical protein
MHPMTLLAQSDPDPTQVAHMMMALIPMIMIFGLICVAIIIVPFWFICKKAGFSPWLALLNVVPFGNLVLIYILAFADWRTGPPPPPATWATGYPPVPPTM